jgi:hypothetical protein
MYKYTILNSTTNITHELYIHDIFELIKQNPDCQYYKIINGEKILIHNKTILNTEFICHRINTVDELLKIPTIFGVELDLRDGDYKQLYLQHDPYIRGECFESYLKSYNHKTMILNIKSERIEPTCIELIGKYNIQSYFFLDSNLPMIYLLNIKHNNNNIACRFSEFEPIENYRCIKHMINWTWIDCFTYQPLTQDIYSEIHKDGTKICIVSPELQGQPQKIQNYRYYFIENDMLPHAICCKLSNIIHWI